MYEVTIESRDFNIETKLPTSSEMYEISHGRIFQGESATINGHNAVTIEGDGVTAEINPDEQDPTKLILSVVVGGGTYASLPDKPSIGGVTLNGNKTAEQLGLQEKINDLANIRSNAQAGKTASDNLHGHTVLKDVPADAKFTDTVYDDTALKGRVTNIEDKMPAQASATNQLADKTFVNSSIATNTAYFRGTYDVVNDLHLTFDATEAQVAAALASVITEVTNNDYAFVVFVDTVGGIPTRYDRYKYGSQDDEWQYEFTLNNSSFTAAEWAAIQSGITSGLVAKLFALPTVAELTALLLGKVDKVEGKGLSTNDYDNTEKTKVAGAEQATNKQTTIPDNPDDTHYPSSKAVKTYVDEHGGVTPVTVIDKDSTHSQIPSAKATYDAINPAKQSTIPSGGMLPNVLYNLGELSGAVSMTLATPEDTNITNQYFFTFETGTTEPSITWDAKITKWYCPFNEKKQPGTTNQAPMLSPNKHYEMSVIGDTAVAMEV